MEVIAISAKAMLPLFVFMGLGYLCRARGILDKSASKQLSNVCFKFFLSTYSAQTIYNANLRDEFELKPVLFVAVSLVTVFLIAWFIVTRFEKDKVLIPTLIQGIYKSNYAILGIPLVQSICGSNANLGIVSVIMVVLVPLNNTLSAFIFEKYTGKATSPMDLVLKVLKNPLILGSLIGIVLNVCKVPIPAWIMSSIISKISALTTPVAMIALGASFEFSTIGKYAKYITWAIIGKLLLIPMILIPLAMAMGIRGPALLAITVFAGAPNAVNSYSTAVALGGDGDLANEIVIMTSLLSIFTLFGWFCLVGFVTGF